MKDFSARVFRFHSCHEAALQALYCLKARAEYELLPNSMQVMAWWWVVEVVGNVYTSQVSSALVRLSQTVKPTSLDLDMDKYSSYMDDGKEQLP